MKITALLSTLIALNLTFLTSPLLADIESDILNSLGNQPSSEHEIRYVARETVVRVRPDSASEFLANLKLNKRVFLLSMSGSWAKVQLVSDEDVSGFVPLSSLKSSPHERAPSTAEKSAVEIDLSGVTLKDPEDIALAQEQRIEDENRQKAEADEAYRRHLKEKRRRKAELEEQQRRQEAQEQRAYEREMEDVFAELDSNETQLAKQWENLTEMPRNITRLQSPYAIERARRQAMRMKKRQARQEKFTAQSQAMPSTKGFGSSPYNGSEAGSALMNIDESNDQSNSSSNSSSPQKDQYADVRGDTASVRQKQNAPQKVYEPMPQVVTGKNLSTFSVRAKAIAYARLKATNKISEQCYGKGARYDSTRFSEIEKGNSSERTTFANADCKQMKSGAWKCTAEVRGHCYRMQ
ncbi:hypothetical protein [Hwanghaeella sp. LZ110]|uniref:hypothetical protein n=1 Tax=Hwanghaeella sp. LZ110 TaxID=3402810 RepID=UPI003B672FC3